MNYGIVRWSTDDVIAAANANGITLTEDQAKMWWKKNEQSFKNMITEHGVEVLTYMNFEVS